MISNGKHAETVSVPLNLCAKVPDSVSDEEAAFTVLGAIALQGIRLVETDPWRVCGGDRVGFDWPDDGAVVAREWLSGTGAGF